MAYFFGQIAATRSFIFSLLAAGLVSNASVAAAQSGSNLEGPVRSLFKETNKLIAYTDQEMAAMVASIEAFADPAGADKRMAAYTKAKAKIEELETKIGKGDRWAMRLPVQLATQTSKLVAGFGWTDKLRWDTRRFAISGKQKATCQKVHSDLAPTVEAINDALRNNPLYSEDARAAAAPYRPKIDAAFKAYEAETQLNIQAYYASADDLNRRRGEVARRIWRFVHAYEDAGLEKAEKIMRRTLQDSLGKSGEAYLNPVWSASHFSTFQSGKDCSYRLATLTQYQSNAVLPKAVAYIGDRITEPVASFDEDEDFLERPPHTGSTLLERTAEALSHRQMQRLKLHGAMATITRELKAQNDAYAELARIDGQLAYATEGFEETATPLISEAEHQKIAANLEKEGNSVTAQLEQVQGDIRAQKEAQRDAAREARLALFIQTGQDKNDLETFRLAKDGEVGRTVSEILAPMRRLRKLHVDARDQAQKEFSDFSKYVLGKATSDPGAILKRYKTLKAKREEKQALVDKADQGIANVQTLKVDSDFDETQLVALQQKYGGLEAKQKDLQTKLKKAQQKVLNARSGSADRQKLFEYGNRLIVGFSNVKQLDPSLSKAVDALMPAARRVAGDRRPIRGAEETLADMNALAKGVEPLRATVATQIAENRSKLLNLRSQGVDVGRKLDVVTNALFNLKRQASVVLQRELPTIGIDEDSDIATQLKDYRQAVSKIKTHLDEGAKLITEKTASAEKHYAKLNGFLSDGQKSAATRAIKGAKWVNGYVEEISKATELLGNGTDKAIAVAEVYNDIAPPSDGSPASAFKHMNAVITRAGEAFAYVPVIGVLGEQYFGYLSYTIGQIEANAKSIKDATVRKLTKKQGGVCLFRTPEEHLYTMAELEASDAMDVSLMTSWFGYGGRDEHIGIQTRRVIALMGAKSVSIACEKPADCNARTTCTRQGKIGWRGK